MNLNDLARDLRHEQQEEFDPRRRRSVRRRLLEAGGQEGPIRRAQTFRRWAAGGLLVAALGAAGTSLWDPSSSPGLDQPPITFAVGTQPGSTEEFVSSNTEPVQLTFSDGSRVNLASGSRARVESLSADGAVLRIEDGRADIMVEHRETTDWNVQAGPYTIHVVGTRFSVEWDARSSEFQVKMAEGRVVVEGPNGFHSSLENEDVLVRGTVARPRSAVDLVGGEVASELELAHEPVRIPQNQLGPPVPRTPEPMTWQELASTGLFDDAHSALGADEFSQLLRLGAAAELELAGTMLRRAQDVRENQLWRSLHRRFPNTTRGADAMYHLARHLFHQGALAECSEWLNRYLDESPGGRWEMEARGRLVEVLMTMGSPRLQLAAQTYLERFPEGPHAAFARRALEP